LLLANLTTSGTTLSSFNYKYDPAGNRTQIVEADGDVVTLAYDPTYHLTNEQRSGANSCSISYTYDPIGNRVQLVNGGAVTTNTYNAGNELVTSQASAGLTTGSKDTHCARLPPHPLRPLSFAPSVYGTMVYSAEGCAHGLCRPQCAACPLPVGPFVWGRRHSTPATPARNDANPLDAMNRRR
jgi:YD repeat-containing protein